MASWSWNAGGSTVTNTAGDIDAEVRANTTAGFSIISYTGDGGSSATVGHGLAQAPELVMYKCRNSAANDWVVYDKTITATKRLKLNTNAAASTSSSQFNDTEPTATVVTIGTFDNINKLDDTYIAYAIHSVEGYSRVGSYEGNNGADGTFVYTGFRPAWVMIKNVDSTPYWTTMDNKRVGYNVDNNQLYPNSNEVESTSDYMDIVSNGFKLRSNDDNVNSSATFIYLAFAESPFKYANAR